MRPKQKKKCLRPDCKSKMSCRGLCRVDYNLAYQLVRQGKTTWEKLEKAGKSIRGERGIVIKWLLDL